MARKLVVEIVGDSKSLERSFARSNKAAKNFNNDLTRRMRGTVNVTRGLTGAITGLAAGLGIAGIGFVAVAKKSVDAATSLNEETTKSEVIFGKSAQAVKDWSETTANAYGISAAAALQAASSVGGLFATLGKGRQEAAQSSKQFVQLAGDLASFFNVTTSDALDKLRSGLAGEAEPLRRFNVFIDEAKVKAEAYRSGIARLGAPLTQAQKIQARWNIILRETGPAQGDAARTADSWANVQRRLGALLEDTAASIGQSLLPALEKYGGELADWLSKEENQKRVIDATKQAVEGISRAVEITSRVVGYLVDEWNQFIGIIQRVKEEFQRFATSMKIIGLNAALAFVEPFSHLPRRFGGWAREAKENMLAQLNDAKIRMRTIGHEAADAYGSSFRTQLSEHLDIVKRGQEVEKQAKKPAVRRVAAAAAAPVRRGITAVQRNQFFDARIARQLDRLQDLSLRKQLARLREIGQAIKTRLAATTDITRRLTLEDKLLDVLRQQRDIQTEIGEQIRAANEALKDRADAIKSAVIEKLQQRQTDILNKRALADAKEQLRIARQEGGRFGIREARRGLQDVKMDMLIARLERAPATLTAGGRFQLAGVVININGISDPAAVANRVAAILKKRGRHTTTQTRPTAAASA